jgi:putative transposase
MDTHFHLIVQTVDGSLSAGMRRLCGGYARWFNWKHDRCGHLFARRFMSRHITDEMHLLDAYRYVALNPVRAGLCADPASWHWGSYRALVGIDPPADFLDVEAVHALFSLRRDEAELAFRAYVGSDPKGSDPSLRV